MTKRKFYERLTAWFRNTSELEQLLLGVVIIITLLVLILIGAVLHHKTLITRSCAGPACITVASQIIEHLDHAVNPCNDFHQFACSKVLKHSRTNKTPGLEQVLRKQLDDDVDQLYLEDEKNDEHYMVKITKRLYKACMNETQIQEDGLETIKNVLVAAGGWPVLEDGHWDERTFDWLETGYTFRQLGYPFSTFLQLEIGPDPENKIKQLFKVTIPSTWSYSNLDTTTSATNAAILFGANRTTAAKASNSTFEFLQKLQEVNKRFLYSRSGKFKIQDYQDQYRSMYGHIDWLEFVSTMAGSTTEVSNKDFALFPGVDYLQNYMAVISHTSRSTQANFIMWKMVDQMLPYLTKEVRKLARVNKPRSEFCRATVQERLNPNPLYIEHARKYLPKEKKRLVEEMAISIISETVKQIQLNTFDWINEKYRKSMTENIKNTEIIVGPRGNYLDDKILNDLDVDMNRGAENNNFLGLISQVNRNHLGQMYKKIDDQEYEAKYKTWSLLTTHYNLETLTLVIPVTSTKGIFFDDSRPNYLNYGSLGTLLSYNILKEILLELYRARGTWFSRKIAGCVSHSISEDPVKDVVMLSFSTAVKVAHSAYVNWVKNNRHELKLVGVKYEPEQLLWITAASLICPVDYPNNELVHVQHALLFNLSRTSEFLQDFDCSSLLPSTEECI